jgi:hypothetical protein
MDHQTVHRVFAHRISGERRAFCSDQCIGKSRHHDISAAKAREILHDGTVHGHPLTDKQRRFFGFIAGGGHD